MSRKSHRARRTAPPRFEYRCYFAVIFLVALFPALWRSLVPPSGPRAGERRAAFGFIGRAWSEARVVTPHIFSA